MNDTNHEKSARRRNTGKQVDAAATTRTAARPSRWAALLMLAILGTVLAGEAFAQGNGRPGGRPGDIGHRDPRFDLRHRPLGRPHPGRGLVDPRDNPNRPTVTLTLEPAGIYAGDQVTLRWRVSLPRDPARRWQETVRLSSTVITLSQSLQENAGNAGSHTFTAPQNVTRGTFTLTTGRGFVAVSKSVDYRALPRPNIARLRVRPAQAAEFQNAGHAVVGDSVALEGSDFGDARGDARVLLLVGGQNTELPISQWGPARIVVTVPRSALLRRGQIYINRRDGRVLSNTLPLEIWGRTVVESDELRTFANNVLDIGATRIHLHRGNNASTVTFPAAAGIADLSFTIPSVVIRDFRFSVNNMDSRNDDAEHDPEVAIMDGQLVIGCLFESRGDEIVGEGRGMLPDGLVPNVQLDRARLNLRFTPTTPANGQFRVGSANAVFTSRVQVGADWLNELVDLSTLENLVNTQIQQEATAAVNTPAVRNDVSSAFMQFLQTMRGVGRVRAVSASGNRMTVDYDNEPN